MITSVVLSISKWSQRHKLVAQPLLFFLIVSLCLFSLFLGFLVPELWEATAGWGAIAWTLVASFCIWKFPRRTLRSNYGARLRFSMALYACAFLGSAWLGSHPLIQHGEVEAYRPVKASHRMQLASHTEAKKGPQPAEALQDFSTRKQGKKEWRKYMRQQLRSVLKKAKRQSRGASRWSKGERILLYFGTGILAFFLSLLVLALSCGVGCSGNAAGGVLLAILGLGILGGALVLFALGIISIFRPKSNPSRSDPRAREEIDG